MFIRSSLLYILLVITVSSAAASEPACYSTADAAAAQLGVRGASGFRLQGRQRDVFSGAVWSTIQSCQHPEQPAFLVLSSGESGSVKQNAPSVKLEGRHNPALILLAGAQVTLVQVDDVTRIVMAGVAQGSGAVGDEVRVRIVAPTTDGNERFARGIVRSSKVVEVVTQ